MENVIEFNLERHVEGMPYAYGRSELEIHKRGYTK